MRIKTNEAPSKETPVSKVSSIKVVVDNIK